jgi:hypothetical protein
MQALGKLDQAEEARFDRRRAGVRRLIDVGNFTVVAIDGQLGFERFDEIERFENVVHRIVIACRGELHFEFASHRAAANAYYECALRGDGNWIIEAMNVACQFARNVFTL